MRLPGYFFFYFSFLFLLFGAVAFHCQCLKVFSLCVKKTKQKQKPEYSNPSTCHPSENITRPVGAQQQKDELCVQSFTDLNRPARLLHHPVTLRNELSHPLWNFSNNQLVHNSPAQSGKKEGGNERSGRQRLNSIFLFFRILPAENALVLQQYELHNLVLIDHVHGDVARLCLGPQQRGSEDDGHALGGHAVGLPVFDHPAGDRTLSICSLNNLSVQGAKKHLFIHVSIT